MDALKHIGIGRVNRGKYRDLGLKVQSFNSQSVKVWSSKICFIAFEIIVNIYQTTGVLLIKLFFYKKNIHNFAPPLIRKMHSHRGLTTP